MLALLFMFLGGGESPPFFGWSILFWLDGCSVLAQVSPGFPFLVFGSFWVIHLTSLHGRGGGNELLYDYVCTHGCVWRESPIMSREGWFDPT